MTSKPNEAYRSELPLGTTALPQSVTTETKKLSTEDRLNVVPTNIQSDEEVHNNHDHASQELPAAISQKSTDISPEHVRQETALDAMLQDPEESAPSTPQQATAWAGYNSPVSSPTDMIRSSELPCLRWLDEIEN